MEAIQKRLATAFLGNIFFIMGQVGGLMICLGAVRPMFHAYLWPGVVVLACTLVWMLWRARTKMASYIIAGTASLMCLWIIIAGLFELVHPPAAESLQESLTAMVVALATGNAAAFGGAMGEYTLAMVSLSMVGIATTGAVIALIGSLLGIMAARGME